MWRGRPTVTNTILDDQHRVVRTVTASPWTAEDRALMLALKVHKRSLCPGCGHPKSTAWHWDNEGWFEPTRTFTCHACTAERGPDQEGRTRPVEYVVIEDTRNYDESPLPPDRPTEGSA